MYQKASSSRVKTQMAEAIINIIHTMKGDFYVPKNGIWVEATMEQILKRVQRALQGKVVRFRSGPQFATIRIFLVDKVHDTSPEKERKSHITQVASTVMKSI